MNDPEPLPYSKLNPYLFNWLEHHVDIDSLLRPFQRFGVHLGLERIERLLADLDNPHHHVPTVHVTGSNGKGSVCAYLSSVLTEAGYRVGRYTSPHLVDWTERICINEQPIAASTLEEVLKQVQLAIQAESEPTQFEVLTAAAWLYFAQMKVDVAVIEVGLGGRLDATNICRKPLVTIITSISREHWQHLGPTLADIAREKAGIFKPGCPAVIGQLPQEAQTVAAARLEELNCSAIWVEPAEELIAQAPNCRWAKFQEIEYPLPLLGTVQLQNSAVAIAALKVLQGQGYLLSPAVIQAGMAKTRWLGRLQWVTWEGCTLLIDGAHNEAAALTLRQYVDAFNQPITWAIGMLSTKDREAIFRSLLRPGDKLYLVPVPDHSSTAPETLFHLATSICPDLAFCGTFTDLFIALTTAVSQRNETELMVLCGSLYLVGYFLRHASGGESSH